jgi:hypothetical protein
LLEGPSGRSFRRRQVYPRLPPHQPAPARVGAPPPGGPRPTDPGVGGLAAPGGGRPPVPRELRPHGDLRLQPPDGAPMASAARRSPGGRGPLL